MPRPSLAELERMYIDVLAERDALRIRVTELEGQVAALSGSTTLPLEFRLTGREGKLLSLLMTHGVLTKEQCLEGMYDDYYHGDVDMPEIKIVDVFICKLRKKLGRYPMDGGRKTVAQGLVTRWGQGYALIPEAKQAIRDLVAAEVKKAVAHVA